MNRVRPAESADDQRAQDRGGRPPARPDDDAHAVAPKHVRGGRRFRYRLLDVAGTEVGVVERDRALRHDELVTVASPLGDATWRVVGVIGTSATVARSNG
jgi:hypothetical protein